jgi:alpha-galactosidase
MNYIFLRFLFILFIFCPAIINAQAQKEVPLTNWKFHTGNNPEWAQPAFDDSQWSTIKVPSQWEDDKYPGYDGYAWYRTKIVIPSAFKQKGKAGISVFLGPVDDRDSTFLNGHLIGSMNGWNDDRNYFLLFDNPSIKWDKENVVSVKVYDSGGGGGIWKSAPAIKVIDFIDLVKINSDPGPLRWVNKTEFSNKVTLATTAKIHISGKLKITVINNITSGVLNEKEVAVSLSDGKPFTYEVHGNVSGDASCQIVYQFTDPVANKTISVSEGIPYLLTPAAPEQPRINGTKVYGVRPNSPVIYRIPVTGVRPMKLSVSQLPDGLLFDAGKGIITGKIAQSGNYTVKLNAENAKGSDTRNIEFKVGTQLALTPPMGWNSWNCFGLSVSDKKIRGAADAFIREGLADYGWTFVNIDDGWEAPKRAQDGSMLSNEKFPDMNKLTEYVHSLGLKIGLYSSPGDYTCGGYLGSYHHEKQDATTWASWGFDYVKYDWCSYGNVKPHPSLDELKEPYKLLGDILSAQPRDIVYSLCQYGMGDVWKWGGEVGGNLWRTTGDITDTWESLSDIGFRQFDRTTYAKPGNWNDPDMLIVGRVGWGDVRPTRLTPDEQYTHISLWSLLAAPLLIGCDLEQIDPFTKNLLCNSEVIDINQDPLGLSAQRVSDGGQLQIWAKPLEDGSMAVGIFNLSGAAMKDAVLPMSLLKLNGKYTVRDVWRQKNVGELNDQFKVTIPAHGCALFKLIKNR